MSGYNWSYEAELKAMFPGMDIEKSGGDFVIFHPTNGRSVEMSYVRLDDPTFGADYSIVSLRKWGKKVCESKSYYEMALWLGCDSPYLESQMKSEYMDRTGINPDLTPEENKAIQDQRDYEDLLWRERMEDMRD